MSNIHLAEAQQTVPFLCQSVWWVTVWLLSAMMGRGGGGGGDASRCGGTVELAVVAWLISGTASSTAVSRMMVSR